MNSTTSWTVFSGTKISTTSWTPPGESKLFSDDYSHNIVDCLRMKYDWKILETENVPIRVAKPEALLEIKRNTMRPQDKQDAMFLDEYIRRKKENK